MNDAGYASLVYEERDLFNNRWYLYQMDYDPILGWQSPTLLYRVAQPYYYPLYGQTALNTAGDKIVTYLIGPDAQNHYALMATSFNPLTGAWSQAQQITATHPWTLVQRNIFVDAQKRATLIYSDDSATGAQLMARQTRDIRTAPWGVPQRLDNINGGQLHGFAADRNSAGNLAVSIVQDVDGDASADLIVKQFRWGAGWGPALRAEQSTRAVSWQSSVTLHDNGTTTVLFSATSNPSSGEQLFESQYHPHLTPGGFTTPTVVSETIDWSYNPLAVSLSQNGALMALYDHTYNFINLFGLNSLVCD